MPLYYYYMLLVLLQTTFDAKIEDDPRDFILPCLVSRFFLMVHSFQFPEYLRKSFNCCRPYKSHLSRTCVYRLGYARIYLYSM